MTMTHRNRLFAIDSSRPLVKAAPSKDGSSTLVSTASTMVPRPERRDRRRCGTPPVAEG